MLLIVCLELNACEQGYSYNYILTNKTDTVITVNIKTLAKDTTFILLADETKNIFSTFHGMEGSGGPFLSPVRFDLERVIIKKGKKISLKDYRNIKSWQFIKISNYKAEYKAIVTDSEF